MLYLRVKDNEVVSERAFTLPRDYVHDGGITHNVALLTTAEKIRIGLYPVIDSTMEYDEEYETLAPNYTINEDNVTIMYDIVPLIVTPYMIEERLKKFAKEKDFEASEVILMLHSSNEEWINEARAFMSAYDKSWQIYYENPEESWKVVESMLPSVVWQ